MISGKLQSWETYVRRLVDKCDWIQALYKLIRMYKGEDLLYAGLAQSKQRRKVLMLPFIESMYGLPTINRAVSNPTSCSWTDLGDT